MLLNKAFSDIFDWITAVWSNFAFVVSNFLWFVRLASHSLREQLSCGRNCSFHRWLLFLFCWWKQLFVGISWILAHFLGSNGLLDLFSLLIALLVESFPNVLGLYLWFLLIVLDDRVTPCLVFIVVNDIILHLVWGLSVFLNSSILHHEKTLSLQCLPLGFWLRFRRQPSELLAQFQLFDGGVIFFELSHFFILRAIWYVDRRIICIWSHFVGNIAIQITRSICKPGSLRHLGLHNGYAILEIRVWKLTHFVNGSRSMFKLYLSSSRDSHLGCGRCLQTCGFIFIKLVKVLFWFHNS